MNIKRSCCPEVSRFFRGHLSDLLPAGFLDETARIRYIRDMCNLYSIRTNREAIRDISNLPFDLHPSIGNFGPQPGVFPDYPAPIVRRTEAGTNELAMVRWGMPSSQKVVFENAKKRAGKLEEKGRPVDFDELLKMEPDSGTTNVRNLESRHWARWTGLENRCVVPFTSFSEFDNNFGPSGKKNGDTWFAFDESRPLAFFAGIWMREWQGVRKISKGWEIADLFAFLTTEPNDIVGSIHMKAMPVILTTREAISTWMTAPWSEAKTLQRPLPNGALKIVGVGAKKDPPDAEAA